MKKIALFMAALGFLAFSGLARAEGDAAPDAKPAKAEKSKKGKKDAPAPAGDSAPKTEKKDAK